MHSIWLHYGGEAIELGESEEATELERRVNETPRPGWLTVIDRDHHTHRLLISEGVSVRISSIYVPAPAMPIKASPAVGNIRDIQF